MNKILDYIKEQALYDPLFYHAFKSLEFHPERQEEIILGVIKFLHGDNQMTKTMFQEHMLLCASPILVINKD